MCIRLSTHSPLSEKRISIPIFQVNIDINDAPQCELPNDTSITLCESSEIKLPVSATDPNGDLVGCYIVNGPGSIVDGFWTYTPVESENIMVTIRCQDECGHYCEGSFTVNINVNKGNEK